MAAKILIVDDSATDRLIIKNMLKDYTVLLASDGAEALEVINGHHEVELMILDLNMPRMNGFEVLEALKSDARYQKVRAIILTNYDELENEIRGLKLGAVDYIRKPINLESLKIRIDIHMEMLRLFKLLEKKLRDSTLTLDTILQQAPVGIAISHNSDPGKGFGSETTVVNAVYERITGYSKNELKLMGWAQITHPDDVDEDLEKYEKLKNGELENYSMEKRYIRPDGSIVWVQMVAARLTPVNAPVFRQICLIIDITKRKSAERALIESERSKSVLLSHLPGLAYRRSCDGDLPMLFVSEGCNELTGYDPESFINNKYLSFADIIADEYKDTVSRERKRALICAERLKSEYEIIAANGQRKWVLELGQGVYDSRGRAEAFEGIILDMSERKKMENQLKYNSEHDSLTGLFNRSYLDRLLTGKKFGGVLGEAALLAVNLSSVHMLSRNYGFQYCQELIKRVAAILRSHTTELRQLFYTNEYQFAFYLENYGGKTQLKAFSEKIADALEDILAMERIDGGIGVLEISGCEEKDSETLLKNLLLASEKALNNGKKDIGVCFFGQDMQEQLLREATIQQELEQIVLGLEPERLYLEFQPICDLMSREIVSFEALARLCTKRHGPVGPLDFIPLAEKSKLIVPLGMEVIRQSLVFLESMQKAGYPRITVSINISAIQLLKEGFAEDLCAVIAEQKADPRNIILEITESIFFANYQDVNALLNKLKDFGLSIAIDDFGTEYSSLAREGELKADYLKIDKHFIDKLLSEDNEKAIASDIVSIGHKLGQRIVAEGVEHEAQLSYLKRHGCDEVQGYLISRPLRGARALEFLNEWQSNQSS